ncbi:MAG: HD-GYP domain-containing protein [Syntrophomonadaceae bacterium]|nr:HD-GYP domain-containing protein [Syntrophomonadaceae bacterium]
MRKIRIDELKTGMVVARAIVDSDGRVLLYSGIQLNERYINKLRELGLNSVYIRDAFDHVQVNDVISDETRIQAIRVVKDNFQALENQHKLNIRAVKAMVDQIIDELLADLSVLVNLTDIRTFDDYTFAHSVNVAVLAIMTCITMGYNDLQLKELGVGAILHDLGKIRIDKSILSKTGELSKEEYEEVKRHPVYGFEILRQYQDVSLLSAHVAFQHHERWDGSGYPRGLSGENILEYARIVAACDVYDALLADRPYRASYTVSQALTILKRMCGLFLDKRCVDALTSNIAVYPIGSVVQLSTGDVGVVVDVNKESPTRPVVRLVIDRYGSRMHNPQEVDLSKYTTVMVAKSLTEEEIQNLL